jgi:hypothetical protein
VPLLHAPSPWQHEVPCTLARASVRLAPPTAIPIQGRRGAPAPYALRQLQPRIPQMTQIQFRISRLYPNLSRRERNSTGRPVPGEIRISKGADS